ncbi:unnamed protein product, partial [Amoebophrya sp. A25]|eukprot:GSA25T00000358001.1
MLPRIGTAGSINIGLSVLLIGGEKRSEVATREITTLAEATRYPGPIAKLTNSNGGRVHQALGIGVQMETKHSRWERSYGVSHGIHGTVSNLPVAASLVTDAYMKMKTR